jgi:DNA repair exonuclease SbcCD nuclease subunit
VKLVHAADLHLDSPLRGLERYEGAPKEAMRAATRRALENLVELCLAEDAALLLLAGDIYDGDWKDYSTGLFFAHQMSRLRQAGVRVALLRGNHDAASQITKHLSLPENVRELATSRAETVIYEDLGVAVHGRGFAKRAVTEDLAAGYPKAVPSLLNVGVLHTALSGREGHEPYAPTTLETLLARGYAYWALGHVHRQEIVHAAEGCTVAFPGNLQGRHARETGPKGALLLDVADGRVRSVEPRTLDAVRWCAVTLDVTAAADGHDVVDLARAALEAEALAADGRPVAVRLTLSGRSPAHRELAADPERWTVALRATATDVAEVWLEKVEHRSMAEIDPAALADNDDALALVIRVVAELGDDAAKIAALAPQLGELARKLPAEARDELGLDDPDELRAILREATDLVLTRLAAARGGP